MLDVTEKLRVEFDRRLVEDPINSEPVQAQEHEIERARLRKASRTTLLRCKVSAAPYLISCVVSTQPCVVLKYSHVYVCVDTILLTLRVQV